MGFKMEAYNVIEREKNSLQNISHSMGHKYGQVS